MICMFPFFHGDLEVDSHRGLSPGCSSGPSSVPIKRAGINGMGFWFPLLKGEKEIFLNVYNCRFCPGRFEQDKGPV